VIPYSVSADHTLNTSLGDIAVFNSTKAENLDQSTVDAFGEEWTKFSAFTAREIESIGDEYFDVVPQQAYGKDKVALDMGCGSGRWSLYAAKHFKFIEAIDPSDAVLVAQKQTEGKNIRVTKAGVDQIPFADESFDFVFSLGVLHHIPDTTKALASLSKKLKRNGFLLLYLYYALDNRSRLYKVIFNLVNSIRKVISSLPSAAKRFVCELLAVFLYLPLVLLSTLLQKIGAVAMAKKIPLHYYVGKSWKVIRNDALDRFGTPLEQRFTKVEIAKMLEDNGYQNIQFSPNMPYWHVVAQKA
jgi:SAM-dependent methyltransferase